MSRRKLIVSAALVAALLSVWGLLFSGQSVGTAQADENWRSEILKYTANLKPTVTTAVQFDVSPPLRDMITQELAKNPTGKVVGPHYEMTERGETNFKQTKDNVGDGALQEVFGPLGPLAIPSPIVSFDGISNACGCSPPDPDVDVGPNHVVEMVNLHFQIFNKTGTALTPVAPNNTLWAGFGGACQTQNAGDPIVLHDQMADRWLLTQFTSSPVGGLYYNCVALSTTADPTGSYYRWAFSNGNNFPDYPKYGVWPDAYYINTRDFLNGSSQNGLTNYAIDRAAMIAGNPNPTVISFGLRPPIPTYVWGDGLLPSDMDGSRLPPAGSPNYFVGTMDAGGPYSAPQDAINFFEFDADFANPPNSTFQQTATIPTAPFDSVPAFCSGRNCVPQPATANRLDHLGYRQRPTWRLAYRNYGTHESLVTNQSVEASPTMSGIRWYELRSPDNNPTIYQQGTYAPGLTDQIHRWMGSIAMDGSGNMALGYSASSATLFPSIRYTGRLATDPLGEMPQGEGSIVEGTGSQTGSQRWGDYTTLHIDPVDDCTFWYTNEYIPVTSSNGWRGRMGAFRFAECSSGGGTATATVVPPSATRTATVANTATRTATIGLPSATATTCPPQRLTVPHNVGLGGEKGESRTIRNDGVALRKGSVQSQPSKGSTGWDPLAPITFILDDGTIENSLGFSGRYPGIWVNRFSPVTADFPIRLNQISILFPDPTMGGRNLQGLAVDLLVYVDADRDNDPSNAVRVFRQATTVQVANGTTFSTYSVNVLVTTPGDLYIGFSDTYNNGALPASYPAPIDETTSQMRSWAIGNGTTPPDYDNLGNNALVVTIDEAGFPGNWAIRAAGDTQQGNNCPTVTATRTSTTVATVTATRTSTVVGTPTSCTIMFTDVPPTDPFYANIRCLACRGIVSGYNDGTFRPYNNITRGQIAKIVSNAAGFSEPVSGQRYEDVLPTNTFYEWIERLSGRGHMGGYPCGQRTTEPCIQPDNRPYFRPTEDATRGQLSKIVSNAAGYNDPVSGVFYADVDESNPFYVEIMRLTNRGVMSGYPCGGTGEPCDPQNRPYFRWGNPVTRGQASKIVANTFYPNCVTP
jgi:hypothetical protein